MSVGILTLNSPYFCLCLSFFFPSFLYDFCRPYHLFKLLSSFSFMDNNGGSSYIALACVQIHFFLLFIFVVFSFTKALFRGDQWKFLSSICLFFFSFLILTLFSLSICANFLSCTEFLFRGEWYIEGLIIRLSYFCFHTQHYFCNLYLQLFSLFPSSCIVRVN